MLFDSHAHLDFVDDLEKVLDRAKEAGVSKILTIGTSIECSKNCIEIAEKHSNSDLSIYATCGIHPEDGKADIEKYGDRLIYELRKVAQSSKKVVGIGECGLDFHLGDNNQRPETKDFEKKNQRKLFNDQIRLAVDLKLPLIIHCRNAWSEIFDQLEGSKGVFHSWTGNTEAMRKALDLNFFISFSGIVTFKNAPEIQEVAKKAPIDKILVETDSPFLSPEPVRGMKNEPKNVKIVADFIAALRDLSPSKIMDITSRNAVEVFNI